MNDTIIVAIISFLGTVVGSFSGTQLIKYRIKKLEEKVEKHNKIVERTYVVEGQVTELQHEMRDLKQKIN